MSIATVDPKGVRFLKIILLKECTMKWIGRFALCCAAGVVSPAIAKDMDIDEVRTMLRENPVSCAAPEGSSCETIALLTFATATRGIEMSQTAFEAAPGMYIVMVTSSVVVLGDDGMCYPDAAEDVMASRFLVTDDLSAEGLETAQPLPEENVAPMQDMLLRPIANMVGTGVLCVVHSIPSERERSDHYVWESFLEDEPFDEPMLVRQMPEESLGGLSLRDVGAGSQ